MRSEARSRTSTNRKQIARDLRTRFGFSSAGTTHTREMGLVGIVSANWRRCICLADCGCPPRAEYAREHNADLAVRILEHVKITLQ